MKLLSRTHILFCCLFLAFTLPASAMNLQQAMSALGNAKAQGLVGEKPDGYLGVVQNSADSAEIVKLINEARRTEYQKVAKDNNIAISDVEAIAGKKAIERTQKGHYIFLNNQWLKKP